MVASDVLLAACSSLSLLMFDLCTHVHVVCCNILLFCRQWFEQLQRYTQQGRANNICVSNLISLFCLMAETHSDRDVTPEPIVRPPTVLHAVSLQLARLSSMDLLKWQLEVTNELIQREDPYCISQTDGAPDSEMDLRGDRESH